jgi:hypothetical protein
MFQSLQIVEQVLPLQFRHQVSEGMAEKIILAKERDGERTVNIKAMVIWQEK